MSLAYFGLGWRESNRSSSMSHWYFSSKYVGTVAPEAFRWDQPSRRRIVEDE